MDCVHLIAECRGRNGGETESGDRIAAGEELKKAPMAVAIRNEVIKDKMLREPEEREQVMRTK